MTNMWAVGQQHAYEWPGSCARSETLTSALKLLCHKVDAHSEVQLCTAKLILLREVKAN